MTSKKDDQATSKHTNVDAHSSARQPWASRFSRRLVATDLVVISLSVFFAQYISYLSAQGELVTGFTFEINNSLVSVVLVVLWTIVLGAVGSRDPHTIGGGSTEYRKVIEGTIRVFAIVAVVALIVATDVDRGYVLMAFPLGLVLLMGARWASRRWLHRRRARGGFSDATLVIGSEATALPLIRQLQRRSDAGYRVIGACIAGGVKGDVLGSTDVPVLGSTHDVMTILETHAIDTVIVAGSDDFAPRRVSELSWALEPGAQHLVLAPSLVDVGGPRVHMRPVVGLPLMHVETPRYAGATKALKRVFDVVAAVVLLVLLSPLFAIVAIMIKVGSPGPVLFRQERVGLRGAPFRMLKFRSMVIDAEDRLESLLDVDREAGNTVLFKMKDDPRITKIGKLLRRTSIDELPQLFNVLGGSMSIVGPRPPLQREVDLYDSRVHRRFLVKPGITGLWQVSGRSSLSWDESVRLDLFYVENWSFANDLVILLKTVRAVFARSGAY